MLSHYLRSLRPNQWTKNFLVFAALLFSQNVTNFHLLTITLEAFVIFCLASGAIYQLNDIHDFRRDQNHPVKSLRPIASGQLPRRTAMISAFLLLGLSLSWSFTISVPFTIAVAGFLLLQILYTYWLKEIVILDLFAIAGGFVIRAVAGGLAISVQISNWLIVCTILLSLFLAISKRRSERLLLEETAQDHRITLAFYGPAFLDQMISMVTSATIISYALYTMSAETVNKFHTTGLKYTIPFVLYGLFRYLYLIYQENKGGEPERLIFSDTPLLINLILYAATVILVLYTMI